MKRTIIKNTAYFLIIFIILSTSFVLYKKYGDIRSANPRVSMPDSAFEEMLVRYFEIQKRLSDLVNGNESKDYSAGEKMETSHFAGIAVSLANADEGGTYANDSIARALATFLEIGRDKDVTNAKRINLEDIDYIEKGIMDLQTRKELIREFNSDNKWSGMQYELLGSLVGQYDEMSMLLEKLLEYKKFHQTEIEAVDMEGMARNAEEIIGIFENIKKEGGEAAVMSYFQRVSVEFRRFMKEQNVILEKNISNLRSISVPEAIYDRDILSERLSLRIRMYEAQKNDNESKIEDIDNGKGLLSLAKESSDLVYLKDLMDENISRYKTESVAAVSFRRIISNDTEIRRIANSLKNEVGYDFDMTDESLEDVVAKFYRNEKSGIKQRIENLISGKGSENGDRKITYKSEFEIKDGQTNLNVLFTFDADSEDETGDIICYLKSPSGKTISREIAKESDGMRFGDSWSFQMFSIEKPEMGKWEAFADSPNNININIKASAKNN